ncbi:Rho termination factor N-terminal domain-containing protein [Sporosarcina contaminans]|uniref:Rho termination factor N-terminal domain-containing protein n=1 Tax=Sporosarcina contaminans TaxID=633403 RepID=A0ABW3TS68_9BACL
MPKVKVKSVPVRYEGTTYQPDEEFSMKAEHVIDSLVEVSEEDTFEPKTVEEMTVSELKEYAAEHDIDLGEAKKKDDILAAILQSEQEQENDPGSDFEEDPEE